MTEEARNQSLFWDEKAEPNGEYVIVEKRDS